MADKGRNTEKIFFIYDHNMLKKEEDDLKDAVLFFYPDHVSEDNQCALCGQLMGMSEFLVNTLGKSSPKCFKLENEKFTIKRIGNYSLGLQGRTNEPDILLIQQLDSMYSTFVTYHGSLDSLRLRHKTDHKTFLSELYCIWTCILEISGSVWSSNLRQTFQHLPYVDLPKNSSHLFVQASHLLQSSQRRPNVIAGAILYKNRVLCTQLSPLLTKQLTFLQQQMPHISRQTDFELPVGCHMVTLFLPDEELYHLHPLHPSSRRHCTGTDFHQQRESDSPDSNNGLDTLKARHLSRRLTYPNDLHKLPELDMKHTSDLSLGAYFSKEQKCTRSSKLDSVSVERHTWSKNKPNVSLSRVPIVECRSGESAVDSEQELVLNHFANKDHFTNTNKKNRGPDVRSSSNVTSTTNSDSPKESQHPKHTDNGAEDDGATISDIEKECEENEKSSARHAMSIQAEVHLNSKISATVETVEFLSNSDSKSDVSLEAKISDITDGNVAHPEIHDTSTDERNADDFHLKSEEVQEYKEISESKTGTISIQELKGDQIRLQQTKEKQSGSVGADDENPKASPKKDLAKFSSSFCESLYAQVPMGEDTKEDSEIDSSEEEEEDVGASISDLEQNTGVDEGREGHGSRKDGKKPLHDLSSLHSETGNTIPNSVVKNHKVAVMKSGEKENLDPDLNVETDAQPELDDVEPCIACLEIQSKTNIPTDNISRKKRRYCSQCLEKLEINKLITSPGGKTETFDFSRSDSSPDTRTSADEMKLPSASSSGNCGSALGGSQLHSLTSSFSSNVSSDSTISRYWTQEMDGLNDVTLYVQCHSNTSISLMLLMENPVHYQENLLHSLWKSALPYLADLDYHIGESDELRREELANTQDNYRFLQYNTWSKDLNGNLGEVPVSSKGEHLHQMISVLHAEFQHSQCLSDVILRSQKGSCYGHRSMMEETYFQLDGPVRPTSGLPPSRDPTFSLDTVSKQRLAKDKNISVL